MGQVNNHTIKRSFYLHFLQIELCVFIIITGIRHLNFRIPHLTHRHPSLFIKRFLFRLLLFGYFETELFSVDSNAVFIFFVFQPDNYRTFTHPISHFESFSCLRINLKFIKAAHFRVQRHPISRLYCSCCIYQFTDRTFFQFDNRYRSSNVIGCVLWFVATAG